MHLLGGDLLKDTLLRIEREKSPTPSGKQTHDLSLTRHVLYRCATTPAPSLEKRKFLLNQFENFLPREKYASEFNLDVLLGLCNGFFRFLVFFG